MTEPKQLPRGWATARAAEACVRIQDGTHFSPKRQLAEGPFPYVTAKNVRPWGMDLANLAYLEEDEHRPIYERTDVREGDVLLVKDGVNAGDAAINTLAGEISLLSSVCFLRPHENVLLPAFLRYFIQSPRGHQAIAGKMTGTAIKRIVLHRVRSSTVLIAPLPEQCRVVEALDSYLSRLDAAQSALERVQTNLERLRASVLQAAVEGRLVPTEAELASEQGRDYEPASALLERILIERRQRWEGAELAKMRAKGKKPKNVKWKAKYKEPVAPDTSELSELPEGWCWARADTLGNVESGTTPKKGRFVAERENDGVPFIKVYNLTFDGSLDFAHNPTFVRLDHHERRMRRSHTVPGDVLTNIVGPPLGKVSIVPDTFPQWNINQAIARFRPLSGLDRQFLAAYLRSTASQRWLRATAKTTTSQVNLAVTTCRRLPVPLPPLVEQKRIAAEVARLLSITEESLGEVESSVTRLVRLRQSVLKWAFEGKLVDQDPTDEPAVALLDRIRGERESNPRERRARRDKKATA